MTDLLTAAQMREIEHAAIAAGQVTGLELMERAGRGVVDAMFEEWPEYSPDACAQRGASPSRSPGYLELEENQSLRAVVLCGPGNNGGDGFVVARLLAELGWAVDVFLYGNAEKLPPDARTNYERWCALGVIAPLTAEAMSAVSQPDLVVDAVFGIGLTRALPETVAEAFKFCNHKNWSELFKLRRVAVDCPSGLDLDTGQVPGGLERGWVAHADLTVTFHTPKPGHYLELGPTLCRALRVVDIGLRGEAMERRIISLTPDPERARLIEGRFFGATGLMDLKSLHWPLGVIGKYRAGVGEHKYEFGHAIVFAGSVGYGGAARMAARAALRSGAGVVTVVCPKAAVLENAMHLNAVMVRWLDDPAELGGVVDDRATSYCIGPGLGQGARSRALVRMVLNRGETDRNWRAPAVVLDADALTSFADDPQELFNIVHARTVLTPHEGEFARLFPDLALSERAGNSKVDVVRAAAARAGCIVLLKGHDTVIAAPDGSASINAASYGRKVPWLATAGAGDVLAGLIAGLAAPQTSADLFCMVEVAAWLHVECARAFGPGLIAEDLPEVLPQVLRELGA